jgi:hypothetical protein
MKWFGGKLEGPSIAEIMARPSSIPPTSYKQQKFGISYHFAWVLGLDWGEFENYEKTDFSLDELSNIKAFDSTYLLTMTKNWVRYQLLPASMHGHRVNVVDHFIHVNEDEPPLSIWSGQFNCIRCKLMGSEETMREYKCQ